MPNLVGMNPLRHLYHLAIPVLLAQAAPAEVISNAALRIELSGGAGTLAVTDLRTKQTWRQSWLETDPALRQRVVAVDATQRTFQLECGMAGTTRDHKGATALFRITAQLDAEKPVLELTFQSADGGGWRQAAYPYAFVCAEAETYNLFPHAEGLLVPVRRTDPTWIKLPDDSLYGGVHAYLACLGLVNLRSGIGLLSIFPNVESTHIRWRDVPTNEGPAVVPQVLWTANKYHFDRPYKVIYHYSDQGGYVSLARNYRAWFAATGLRKTLKQKLVESPALDKIAGAPIFWAVTARSTAELREMADILKNQGIDRCLFAVSRIYSELAHNQDQQDLVETLRYINSLGYVTYRYDQYRDAFQFDPTGKAPHQINTKAWPEMIVRTEEQRMVQAFGPTSGVICSKFFLPLATKNLDYEFSTFPYGAWFLDCLGSVSFNAEAECWHPGHPCDAFDTRREREALMKLANHHGILTATECGLDYLIPYAHWFEGATTLVSWHEQFPPGEKMPVATGNINATPEPGSTAYRELSKLKLGDSAPPTVSLSTAYRIPFYSLVHHDEAIVTWRWEDGMFNPPVYWPVKILWSVLYGAPPMYRPYLPELKQYQAQVGLTEEQVSQWVRLIAYDAMLDHVFLTPDRSVQQTTFSSGRGAIANFGAKPYEILAGPVLPAGGYVTFTTPHQGKRAYDKPVIPLQP